jgi:hypothetical protein
MIGHGESSLNGETPYRIEGSGCRNTAFCIARANGPYWSGGLFLSRKASEGTMRKTLIAFIASASLAAAVTAPDTAEARCRGCWAGAAIGAGVVGALIAGSAYGYGYGYPAYGYGYRYAPAYGYAPYGYGYAAPAYAYYPYRPAYYAPPYYAPRYYGYGPRFYPRPYYARRYVAPRYYAPRRAYYAPAYYGRRYY